jgi:HAD superfamily hydrolase (TIGR01509 family)
MEKAFIFDMDGVIADSETAYMESFNRILKGFSIRIDREEWFRRFPGTGTIHTMSTVFREHGFNPKEGLDYWLDAWKREYQRMIKKGEIKTIRGFLEFNKRLNELRIKKIIATGSHKSNAFIALKSFGIENEFDIIGNEDVKERKPSPELFLVAAKRLDSEPGDCIVFEDSVVGLKAAKTAGMKCVALTTTAARGLLEGERPYLIINDYTEIDIEELLK